MITYTWGASGEVTRINIFSSPLISTEIYSTYIQQLRTIFEFYICNICPVKIWKPMKEISCQNVSNFKLKDYCLHRWRPIRLTFVISFISSAFSTNKLKCYCLLKYIKKKKKLMHNLGSWDCCFSLFKRTSQEYEGSAQILRTENTP